MGKTGKRLFQAVLAVLILGLGVIGLVVLTMSKPELAKKKPVVEPPAVMTARVGLEASVVMVRGQGVVKPVREINLAPQVSGKVVQVSPSLVNGGEFNRGDILFSINPEDYKLALATASGPGQGRGKRAQTGPGRVGNVQGRMAGPPVQHQKNTAPGGQGTSIGRGQGQTGSGTGRIEKSPVESGKNKGHGPF